MALEFAAQDTWQERLTAISAGFKHPASFSDTVEEDLMEGQHFSFFGFPFFTDDRLF